MNADEDPDWEAEAEAAVAEDKRREFWKKAAACHQKLAKSKPLNFTTLPRDTRFVVKFFEEDGAPLATGPIEFTMLDPASCKVLVKGERNFTEPTEGTLLGSEHFTSPPYKRVFYEGKLAQFCWLNFEASGKKFDKENIPHTIKAIQILVQSGKPIDLWND